MPTKQEITHKLRDHADELHALFVKSIELFGSVASGKAGPESDVDLLVEFDPDGKVGLFHFLRVKEYLSEILGGVEVDLATRDGLHPSMREQILATRIPIFALFAVNYEMILGHGRI